MSLRSVLELDLVLVQPRKTRPDLSEKNIDWDIKNQNKTKQRFDCDDSRLISSLLFACSKIGSPMICNFQRMQFQNLTVVIVIIKPPLFLKTPHNFSGALFMTCFSSLD